MTHLKYFFFLENNIYFCAIIYQPIISYNEFVRKNRSCLILFYTFKKNSYRKEKKK